MRMCRRQGGRPGPAHAPRAPAASGTRCTTGRCGARLGQRRAGIEEFQFEAVVASALARHAGAQLVHGVDALQHTRLDRVCQGARQGPGRRRKHQPVTPAELDMVEQCIGSRWLQVLLWIQHRCPFKRSPWRRISAWHSDSSVRQPSHNAPARLAYPWTTKRSARAACRTPVGSRASASTGLRSASAELGRTNQCARSHPS